MKKLLNVGDPLYFVEFKDEHKRAKSACRLITVEIIYAIENEDDGYYYIINEDYKDGGKVISYADDVDNIEEFGDSGFSTLKKAMKFLKTFEVYECNLLPINSKIYHIFMNAEEDVTTKYTVVGHYNEGVMLKYSDGINKGLSAGHISNKDIDSGVVVFGGGHCYSKLRVPKTTLKGY